MNIKEYLKMHEEMIICPDCNVCYLPLTIEAEELCPICGVEINEPIDDEYDLDYYDDEEWLGIIID